MINANRFKVTKNIHPYRNEVACQFTVDYTVLDVTTGKNVIVLDTNKNPTDKLTKKQLVDLMLEVFEPTNFRGLP